MIDRIKRRASEPSTYAGIAAVTYGLGQVFKLDHANEIGRAIESTGQAISVAPDGQALTLGLITLIGGLLSIFMGEKGKR